MYATTINVLLNSWERLRLASFTQSSNQNSNNVLSLPPEILVQVFSNLDATSLSNAQSTCCLFNEVVKTHRAVMKPSNIGTLDVIVNEDASIEYVKHLWVSTGMLQMTKFLKYKGTGFKLEHSVIDRLNISLHHIDLHLISQLNLSNVKAKTITIKLMSDKVLETDVLLSTLVKQIKTNLSKPKLQICFMQECHADSICALKELPYCNEK